MRDRSHSAHGIICLILLLGFDLLKAQDTSNIKVPGLLQTVTILTDQWGVSHIYAQNEHDLFFAQGFTAAKDRLFQFEMWRRQATGTASEILGERELHRDIGARLFKFRGNIKQELNHYHDRGQLIVTSFVEGINAYINLVLEGKEKLPMEFSWLGIKPGFWTPEVVISRHNGLLGNVQEELQTARWVRQIGAHRVVALMNFHPLQPGLTLDTVLTKDALSEDILKLYNAYRRPIQFKNEDLIGSTLDEKKLNQLNAIPSSAFHKDQEGSNNWVISGAKSSSGYPMMANDPHRAIAVPSLRYLTHLHAPGWNVIGGGEPILPGISIGHNEYGAWGLTIFDTDIEDLYVYKINPRNLNQYWHQNHWVNFNKIKDTIHIEGGSATVVDHQYSKHGPVTFVDTTRHLAYAVRCAWLEIGSAPYLASLRMDQAKSWTEFRKACNYSFVPAENMVWADRKGNIGWQAVGIAPIRNNHSGMVPVISQAKNEWSGYIPVLKRPGAFNPSNGILATANENLTPPSYPYMNSIGYTWADPYRGNRVREVLNSKNKITIEDIQSLQTDYFSIPASQIIPMIQNLKLEEEGQEHLKQELLNWDKILSRGSGMAGLYVWLERYLEEEVLKIYLPENTDVIEHNNISINSISTETMIKILKAADTGGSLLTGLTRDSMLQSSFVRAVFQMKKLFGNSFKDWKYGAGQFKHITINHTLSKIVNEKTQELINTRTAPRGGYGNTVGSTGDNDNQSSGASFRIVVDCGDWDNTKAINTPGQSGSPDSRHYKDLFDLWANDQYFPLYFSRDKVNRVTEQVLRLVSK